MLQFLLTSELVEEDKEGQLLQTDTNLMSVCQVWR